MGGIAQQDDPPDPPNGQRLAVIQRLSEHARRRRDDGADGVVPTGILGQRILDAARSQPGFPCRLFRSADAIVILIEALDTRTKMEIFCSKAAKQDIE